jgi:Sec-independent protein secretion pathway component TatC
VGAVAIGTGLAYNWRGPILTWLEAPLRQTLYYSQVTGAFEFIVQACLLTGVLGVAPVIVYQLIAFIRPALSRPVSNRSVAALITLAVLLMVSGVAFGYYVTRSPMRMRRTFAITSFGS